MTQNLTQTKAGSLNVNSQLFPSQTARQKVIQHLLNWKIPKITPSASDKLYILNTMYSFRLDTTRKLVEHVIKQDDMDDDDIFDDQVDYNEVSAKKVKTD
jgi:hypothetical protein